MDALKVIAGLFVIVVLVLSLFGAVFLQDQGGGQWLYLSLWGKQPWERAAWLEESISRAVPAIRSTAGLPLKTEPPLEFSIPPGADPC